MHTYLENYSIARQLAHQLKQSITSSNDILDRAETPRVYSRDIERLITRYGENSVQSFLHHAKVCEEVRRISIQTLRQNKAITLAPTTTLLVAISLLGIGECNELSNRLIIELLKHKRNDFQLLYIRNHLTPYDAGKDHAIVILGNNTNPLQANDPLSILNTLPNECVAIDLLLNHVGPANALLRDQDKYYKAYLLQSILIMQTFMSETGEKDALKIESNAIELAKATGITPYKPTDFIRRNQEVHLYHLPTAVRQFEPTEKNTQENRNGLCTGPYTLFFDKETQHDNSRLEGNIPMIKR